MVSPFDPGGLWDPSNDGRPILNPGVSPKTVGVLMQLLVSTIEIGNGR